MKKMEKIGNKGFTLSEVVVVSVVIAIILITLFGSINRLSTAYNRRSTYDDIDTAYIAGEVNNFLLDKGMINSMYKDEKFGLIKDNISSDIYEELDNNILTSYDDSNIALYFLNFDKNTLNSLENEKKTFKEYIDYLGKNIDFDEEYTYMIIVEKQDKEDINNCYYYCLKVR